MNAPITTRAVTAIENRSRITALRSHAQVPLESLIRVGETGTVDNGCVVGRLGAEDHEMHLISSATPAADS